MLWREYRRRQQRYRWRFLCSFPAHVDGVPVTITDLHEAGLSFTAEGMNIAVGSTVPVNFQAALGDLSVPVEGSATVVRSQSREGGLTVYGCTVEWSTPRDRRNVIDLCYVFLAAQDRGYVVELDAQVAQTCRDVLGPDAGTLGADPALNQAFTECLQNGGPAAEQLANEANGNGADPADPNAGNSSASPATTVRPLQRSRRLVLALWIQRQLGRASPCRLRLCAPLSAGGNLSPLLPSTHGMRQRL